MGLLEIEIIGGSRQALFQFPALSPRAPALQATASTKYNKQLNDNIVGKAY